MGVRTRKTIRFTNKEFYYNLRKWGFELVLVKQIDLRIQKFVLLTFPAAAASVNRLALLNQGWWQSENQLTVRVRECCYEEEPTWS